MNFGKKLLATVAAVMLLINLAPAALATQTTDYTELEMQLAIANGLRSHDYTSQTWKPMADAIYTADRYLKGKYGQQAVDEAVEDLEKAMAGLVKMDYSQLENTLAAVYKKIDEDPEMHSIWVRLNSAVESARPLLVSGNQQAVNQAVEDLNTLLTELSGYENDVEREPEVVVQEVEVEVLPTDDYCNIPMHRTWPILFVGSAVLNVMLIVVLVYVIMKKKKTYDDTPLVSYDIDEDLEY